MIILTVLILLVPALISVLLYERFRGYELVWRKRVELLFVFAFMLNLLGNAVFWLRGWDVLSWAWSGPSHLGHTSFVTQYMLITLVGAVALAYVMTLVRVNKMERREDAPQDSPEDAESETGGASDDERDRRMEKTDE